MKVQKESYKIFNKLLSVLINLQKTKRSVVLNLPSLDKICGVKDIKISLISFFHRGQRKMAKFCDFGFIFCLFLLIEQHR
jgi:hypothetical protein